MKKLFLSGITLLLFLFCANAQAQSRFNITGTVADSLGRPLVSATVMIMKAADSTLVNFAPSNDRGFFEMRRVEQGEFILQVSYLGYQTISRPLQLTAGLPETIDLGTLTLLESVTDLGQVTVTEERIPVRIKKDTIEFDARAFKTQPNAVVEDLLKKLPGVQVESDGTVRAQGQEVQRVTVDGKEFFGRDPKIATKNLPADAVDKMQVFDKKSDQTEFTGIDDGRREKTINLELKEEKKKGAFGSAMAGLGSDQRFQGKANLNRFSTNQQLSLIGMGNNINEQGFSINDYMNFMGGMNRMMSGGSVRISIDGNSSGLPINFGQNNGFVNTIAGGINFNREWNDKKTELNGSYFLSRLDREYERTSSRQTFLPDRTFNSQGVNLQNDLSASHRLNLRLDHKFDSLQSIRLTANMGYSDNRSDIDDSNQSFLSDGIPENTSDRLYHADGDNKNLSTELLYRRKFQKKGRTFSANLSFGAGRNDQTGELDAVNRFFSIPRADTILQTNTQGDDSRNYGLRLVYTEPLSRRSLLEFNYGIQKNDNDLLRKVYDLTPGLETDPVFNPELSSDYQSDYTYHRGGTNFRLNHKAYNLTAGLNLQRSGLNGQLPDREINISQSFVNLLPSLQWNYEFSSSKHFNLTYATSVREPSLRELQPVADNSDPLNIYEGNPDLRPEYEHAFQGRYFSFDQFSFTSIFGSVEFALAKNKIAYAQSIDDQFIRSYQPVNTDQEYNMRAYLSFGTPIRKVGMQVNLSSSFNYVRGLNFINDVENTTSRMTVGGDLRLENRKKEKIDASVGVRLSYNQAQYSIDAQLNQDFLNQEYYGELAWNLPLNFVFNTRLNYTIYSGLSEGFDQGVPIWNASLSKYLLKDKRLELKLAVADVFNQNVGISRTTQLTYVEDVRIRSLGRFFMLSAAWSLQGFGAQQGPGIRFTQRR
jgi:hypothetical protein